MTTGSSILALLKKAKQLAKEYYALTGRPLGVTGEIGEYQAVSLRGLELAEVRQSGYDAIRRAGGKRELLQIKTRRILPNSKPGQRIGSIQLDKEWDAVLLVLLDEDFEAYEIYQAERADLRKALLEPGSKARNERGALGVTKFKSIGRRIWSRNGGC